MKTLNKLHLTHTVILLRLKDTLNGQQHICNFEVKTTYSNTYFIHNTPSLTNSQNIFEKVAIKRVSVKRNFEIRLLLLYNYFKNVYYS